MDYLILEKSPWPLQANVTATVLTCAYPGVANRSAKNIRKHVLDTVLRYARIYYTLAI